MRNLLSVNGKCTYVPTHTIVVRRYNQKRDFIFNFFRTLLLHNGFRRLQVRFSC